MVFQYTKNPNDKIPIIVVDKHIGNDADNGEGIMGGQFLDEVFELRNSGKRKADVWINSPGGSMIESMNIEGAIGLTGVNFDTLNYGIAASASGTIYLKGEVARMTPNAIFMCHDPSGGNDEESSSEQKAFTESVAIRINEGSGRNGKPKITVDEAKKMMKETTFLTADECLEIGLCDEIVSFEDYSPTNFKAITANDFFLAGNKILNSLLQKNNIMAADTNLLLITNELELGEDASQKEIAKGIKSLKTKANRVDVLEETNKSLSAQVTDLTKLKNDMDDKIKEKDDSIATKDNEYMDMKNKHDALMTECNTLKEKMDAFEKDADQKKKDKELEDTKRNETDCVNMVDSFKNKLGNDPAYITEWVNTAKTLGLDKARGMLEKLPFNGKAPGIKEIVKKVDHDGIYVDTAGKTGAEVLMAKKRLELQEKRNRSNASIK